jgi:cytosine/adenosine deaminase-related metal-dependent hydrolase
MLMPKPSDSNATLLIRAAWVVPVTGPPLANGSVLLQSGRIVAVDAHPTMVGQLPLNTKIVDYGDVAILPGLVNAHTHLELTALAGHITLRQSDFPAWLRQLLPLRSTLPLEAVRSGIRDGTRQLHDGGVAVCGDVTLQPPIDASSSTGVSRHAFIEVLGFNVTSLDVALEPAGYPNFIGNSGDIHALSLSAHAPYSTSSKLIQAVKGWDRDRRLPFSIHVAETREEVQFLQDGTGFFRELLPALGRWVPSWQAPGMSPVAYLDHLGVLDELTLLVHTVHLNESDWSTVAERGCSVCFCPRSNAQLQVGRPGIETAVELGIPMALGTDSLASNRDLNVFHEAAYVLDHYPLIPPQQVLHMATLGGARALRQDKNFGSIEPGKRAALLAVQLPLDATSKDLMATVIRQGSKGAWRWVETPHWD